MDVSPDYLKRFFTKEGGSYAVTKQNRDLIVFAVQSVVKDPLFSKLDLISCRNLLIYLSPTLQKKLLPLFHYSLNQGGFLFLGSSETIGEFGDLFAVVDPKWKLFKHRTTLSSRRAVVDFPASSLADGLVTTSTGDKVFAKEKKDRPAGAG